MTTASKAVGAIAAAVLAALIIAMLLDVTRKPPTPVPVGASSPVSVVIDGDAVRGHRALILNNTTRRFEIRLRNANNKLIDNDSSTPATVGYRSGVLFGLRGQKSPYHYSVAENGAVVYSGEFKL
ncbi:hypothetical protein JKP88DRAFT_251005 [Tribonema minus]|uniref:Uncharacterized protein n=1 Tax=Tribonema minus TaxID=303371 RepID=A0A836CNX6_9STRA|nr:hypothetical protein JKP88DRAFT_251005 [Tribonema minus]